MTTMLVGVLQENNAYDSLDLKNIEDFNEYQTIPKYLKNQVANGISSLEIFLMPKEMTDTFLKSKHLLIAEACENFSPL